MALASTLSAQAEKVAQAIWTAGNTTLTFIYDETVYNEGDIFKGETVTNVWNGDMLSQQYETYWGETWENNWNDDVKNNMTTAVFEMSFKGFAPTNTSCWFSSCKILSKIEGIENLNTGNVTEMCCMFSGCRGLTSLDLSHFDTGNVNSMSGMFSGCSSLTSLDLSNFNTGNVTNMGDMFWGCSALTSLDVTHFDTGNVTNMSCMFYGCSFLSLLDVSHFDTGNVTDMTCMFSNCSSLTSLDVSNFNTANVTRMCVVDEGMFSRCSGLTSLDLSHFDTGNVTDMGCMFSGCSSLTSLDVSNFDTGKVTYMAYMFCNCSGLMSLDLSHFDTGNVTWMAYMFYGCSALTSLDVSHFDTSNVMYMTAMFSNCSSLTSLDVSNINTAKVTKMGDYYTGGLDAGMFSGCSSLTSLDLSNFDTGNVTDMCSMFYGCSGLTSLDVTNFDTGNVTNMSSMFRGCSALTSLDLSNFDTSNVTGISSIFEDCCGLKNLSLGSGFTADNVTTYPWGGGEFYFVSDLKIYVNAAAKETVDASLAKLHFDTWHGYTTTTDTPRTVSGNGKDYWGTYYNSVASMTVPEGVEAYTAKVEGDELVLTKIEDGIVAKGNAVVLKSVTPEVVLDVNTEPKNIIEGNELQGVDVDTAAPTNCMALGVENNKAGLWRPQEEGAQVMGHEAFIVYADNEAIHGFPFPGETGETVGICTLNVQTTTGKAYTLDGRPASSATNGVTIVRMSDGTLKKVVVK